MILWIWSAKPADNVYLFIQFFVAVREDTGQTVKIIVYSIAWRMPRLKLKPNSKQKVEDIFVAPL